MSNAIHYDNKYLTISVEQLETGVRIELANDGEPIAADDLEHLFERFYKGKSGPFGLGLAITKEIIERHQGTIRATSNEEKTCFIIDLPNIQKHLWVFMGAFIVANAKKLATILPQLFKTLTKISKRALGYNRTIRQRCSC